MLIPQEYKQTEFGVIPKDWDITTIGKACYVNPNNGEIPNKFLYIDLESVNRGILEKKKYINKKEAPSRAQRLVKKKDVLFQLVRPYQQNNYFNTKYTVAVASTGYAVLREHLINIDLIYQIIHTKNFTKQVLDKCTGTSYPAITSTNFENVKFCYPKNYLEQKCIATVLNDTDKLINNLNKLIKKKTAIKQGAMQELLTGKRRLPGFNGKWTTKKICEIGRVITGSTPSRNNKYLWNGNLHWVSAQDLKNKYIFDSIEKITDEGAKYCSFLPVGAVLVTCIASIGLNAIARVPLATNQQINSIICNKDFYNEYIYYLLSYNRNILIAMADKTAVPIISKQNFESMSFLLPKDKKEQRAIARILADMDNEIEKLEIKLQKYKKIKQGMMQQLLTGRIRLLD